MIHTKNIFKATALLILLFMILIINTDTSSEALSSGDYSTEDRMTASNSGFQYEISSIGQEKNYVFSMTETERQGWVLVLDALKEEIGTGYLGEEYEFDEVYYPYYGMLDDELRKIYKQVYANAVNQVEEFAVSEIITHEEFYSVFNAVCNDHPELFYLDTCYGARRTKDEIIISVTLMYNRTLEDLETAQLEFEESARKILTQVPEGSSDYETEVMIHDLLAELVTYNYDVEYDQSAYSALVGHEALCAGYARAYQYLMQQAGIPTYYCGGIAKEEHAWDIVDLDGEYYNVDVTWDDQEPMTYKYFNLTDDEISETHQRTDLSTGLPSCTGEAYGTPDEENVD